MDVGSSGLGSVKPAIGWLPSIAEHRKHVVERRQAGCRDLRRLGGCRLVACAFLASATAFLCSPTGSITFTIANASTTRDYAFFRIKFVGNGGAGVALTWPATVKDATSISIGPAGSTVTILELMTFDHGGSWYYQTLATGRTP